MLCEPTVDDDGLTTDGRIYRGCFSSSERIFTKLFSSIVYARYQAFKKKPIIE